MENFKTISDLLTETLREIEDIEMSGDSYIGIPSGFRDLDRVTNGFRKGEVTIIAARPGMGKTSLALSITRKAAVDYKKSIAFFSPDISNKQLALKFISAEADIKVNNLTHDLLSGDNLDALHKKLFKLWNANIYINDTPILNIVEIEENCRQMKLQYGIEMVMIDSIQLINFDENGNRQNQMKSTGMSLKALALELDIPILIFYQLGRQVEARSGLYLPILSDINEYGPIERIVDLVIFIYRPEYYNIIEDEEGKSTEGMAEIIIAKNRNGGKNSILLKFEGKYGRFTDWEFIPSKVL